MLAASAAFFLLSLSRSSPLSLLTWKLHAQLSPQQPSWVLQPLLQDVIPLFHTPSFLPALSLVQGGNSIITIGPQAKFKTQTPGFPWPLNCPPGPTLAWLLFTKNELSQELPRPICTSIHVQAT